MSTSVSQQHQMSSSRLGSTPIRSEAELDGRLSEPSPLAVEAMRELDGDLYVLGAGGKMGPTLARMATRALKMIGSPHRVHGVARFHDSRLRDRLEEWEVGTIACDLLDRKAVDRLPDARNLIFMAGQKFGTTGHEDRTWAINTHVPALVAERYVDARVVVFSTGCVYPLSPIAHGGLTEDAPLEPVGEYGNSCVGRERIFEYYSRAHGLRCAIMRLSYAIDLRYGVLLDIAQRVMAGQPIPLEMGATNMVWQGDACARALALLGHCAAPPFILNITGPETVSTRAVAERFGEIFAVQPIFTGVEEPHALLIDSARSQALFGYPQVSLQQMIEWTAAWLTDGGTTWNKPTHFEVRDGKY